MTWGMGRSNAVFVSLLRKKKKNKKQNIIRHPVYETGWSQSCAEVIIVVVVTADVVVVFVIVGAIVIAAAAAACESSWRLIFNS